MTLSTYSIQAGVAARVPLLTNVVSQEDVESCGILLEEAVEPGLLVAEFVLAEHRVDNGILIELRGMFSELECFDVDWVYVLQLDLDQMEVWVFLQLSGSRHVVDLRSHLDVCC